MTRKTFYKGPLDLSKTLSEKKATAVLFETVLCYGNTCHAVSGQAAFVGCCFPAAVTVTLFRFLHLAMGARRINDQL